MAAALEGPERDLTCLHLFWNKEEPMRTDPVFPGWHDLILDSGRFVGAYEEAAASILFRHR